MVIEWKETGRKHEKQFKLEHATQKLCQHSIPKEVKITEPRISFTFRSLKLTKNQIRSAKPENKEKSDDQHKHMKEVWEIVYPNRALLSRVPLHFRADLF